LENERKRIRIRKGRTSGKKKKKRIERRRRRRRRRRKKQSSMRLGAPELLELQKRATHGHIG
jgi:hypothetical protein